MFCSSSFWSTWPSVCFFPGFGDITKESPINKDRRNRINERVRVPRVRLIDENKNQVGIVPTTEALDRAKQIGLDLVEIAPDAAPPVCQIMDFGKFLYDKQKREKDAKKKQHITKHKEIKLSPRTEDHDYQYRMERARKFLADNDHVKITIVFKGRELAHKEFGYQIIEKFRQDLGDIAVEERPATFMGRNLVSIFTPKK